MLLIKKKLNSATTETVSKDPEVRLCTFWRGLIAGRQTGASWEKAHKLDSKMPPRLGLGRCPNLLLLLVRRQGVWRDTEKLNSRFETLPCFSQLAADSDSCLVSSQKRSTTHRQSVSVPDAQDMACCHCQYNKNFIQTKQNEWELFKRQSFSM
ncbi:uncharacterized [Tachysurus ichikawai]